MRRNVIDLIREITRQRGQGAETTVDIILDEMMEDGEIVSFYKTARRADKFQGIDFYIFKINGEKVPLQVKSSRTGARNHREEFSDIPVIIVKIEDDTKTIKNKIRKLLI